MKTFTKIALAVALLATAASSHAEWVNGYFRASGTYVSGYHRSTPSYTPGYSSSSYSGYGSTPCYPTYSYTPPVSVYGSSTTMGDFTFHNYYSSGGGSLSGSTINIGNTSFTTLYGW